MLEKKRKKDQKARWEIAKLKIMHVQDNSSLLMFQVK